jgi:hypothetical protein
MRPDAKHNVDKAGERLRRMLRMLLMIVRVAGESMKQDDHGMLCDVTPQQAQVGLIHGTFATCCNSKTDQQLWLVTVQNSRPFRQPSATSTRSVLGKRVLE